MVNQFKNHQLKFLFVALFVVGCFSVDAMHRAKHRGITVAATEDGTVQQTGDTLDQNVVYLPKHVYVRTYNGSNIDREFLVDAGDICHLRSVYEQICKRDLSTRCQFGLPIDPNELIFDLPITARQWYLLAPFLNAAHLKRPDLVLPIVTQMNDQERLELPSLADRLEDATLNEAVGELVNPESFLVENKLPILTSYSNERSVVLFDGFFQKELIAQWLSPVKSIEGAHEVHDVSYSPDGSKMFVRYKCKDNEVLLFDVPTGNLIGNMPLSEHNGGHMVWSPDSLKILFFDGYDISIFDVVTCECIKEINAKNEIARIRSVAWSPDGTKILVGGGLGTIGIWDAQTGGLIVAKRITCQNYPQDLLEETSGVAWCADAQRIVVDSRGYGNCAALLDATTLATLKEFSQEEHYSRQKLGCSYDASKIATVCNRERTITVYDVQTGATLSVVKDLRYCEIVAWSPDAKRIIVYYFNEHQYVLGIVDAQTGTLVVPKLAGAQRQRFAYYAWSPHGDRIAGYNDGAVGVWDALTGKLLAGFSAESFGAESSPRLFWSPDGKKLIIKSNDTTVSIVDLVLEEQLQSLTLAQGALLSAVLKRYQKNDGSKVNVCAHCRPDLHQVYNSLSPAFKEGIAPYILVDCHVQLPDNATFADLQGIMQDRRAEVGGEYGFTVVNTILEMNKVS